MLKTKVVKLILDELKIKPLEPFLLDGYNTPYRLKKDGGMERYLGRVWGETSFCYTDLIVLIDADMVRLLDKEEKENIDALL